MNYAHAVTDGQDESHQCC